MEDHNIIIIKNLSLWTILSVMMAQEEWLQVMNVLCTLFILFKMSYAWMLTWPSAHRWEITIRPLSSGSSCLRDESLPFTSHPDGRAAATLASVSHGPRRQRWPHYIPPPTPPPTPLSWNSKPGESVSLLYAGSITWLAIRTCYFYSIMCIV